MNHSSRAARGLTLLVALALPVSASAAPLGELPFQRVPDGTACLAPTGAPGELSRWAEGGAEVLTAGPEGFGRPALVRLGELPGCPRVDADASGAAVAAAATDDALRVALREPGSGSFGAPVSLAAAENVFELSVAVSPHGDAVVAWVEWDRGPQHVRVRVVRRDAGSRFGAPVDLVPWRPGTSSVGVLTGMAADGEAVVLVHEPRGGSRSSSVDTVRSGVRGAPLGPATPLPAGLHSLALGVAPDGRIVVGATESGSVAVVERPRGDALGAPQRLTDPAQPVDANQMAVAFGPDGRRVVAWHDDDEGTTGAAVRDGAIGFSPPVVIVPTPKSSDQGFATLSSGPAIVGELPPLHAAFAPDGRVSVAWPDGGARLATLSGNAVVERERLGATLRSAGGLSLLALADGRRALAWTNHDQSAEDGPTRVHLAVEGVQAPPEPAAPRVTVGRARDSTLRPGEDLVLPVRCSAACDLEASLAAEEDATIDYSLTRAGTVNVRLAPPGRAIAPARPGPVRVTVRSSAPGARTTTRTIATLRLRRLPALPFPRVEDVRARRLSGGRVEVRWRASSDARDTFFLVTGTRARDAGKDNRPAVDGLWGQRRTSYRVVLEDAADTRWLHIRVFELIGKRDRSVTVRMR